MLSPFNKRVHQNTFVAEASRVDLLHFSHSRHSRAANPLNPRSRSRAKRSSRASGRRVTAERGPHTDRMYQLNENTSPTDVSVALSYRVEYIEYR